MFYLGNVFNELYIEAKSKKNHKECIMYIQKAIHYYEQAAALNSTDALYNLGTLYNDGVEKIVDSTGNEVFELLPNAQKSLDYFYQAAELKDSSALFWLGYLAYSNEKGETAVNYNNAIRYFKEASDLNHDQADYYLALLYNQIVNAGPIPQVSSNFVMDDLIKYYYYMYKSLIIHENTAIIHYLASYCHNKYFTGVYSDNSKPESYLLNQMLSCYACKLDKQNDNVVIDNHILVLLDEKNAECAYHLVFREDGYSYTYGKVDKEINTVDDKLLYHSLRLGTLTLLERGVKLNDADCALMLGKYI